LEKDSEKYNSDSIKEVINMEDKQLVCKDCGCTFTFTAGEQEFYKEKGFENEPQRCPECRAAKKRQRNNKY
jgi:hypothetical protein